MSGNPRKIHTNAIHRVKEFMQSDEFQKMDILDLDARMDLLKETYVKFIEEHQKMVQMLVEKERFAAEDNFFQSN